MYHQEEQSLSRRSALLAALLCAGLGIAASVITADLFIIGLERLESDTTARQALKALGILIIASELAAFGLAAWMPPGRLWAQRWKLYLFGTALLCFEFWTLTATNIALVQTADAVGSAHQGRITELRASIQSQRETAKGLRANAANQSASKYSWTRSEGAASLKRAADIEADIAPLALELSRLEGQKRPTLSTALGDKGMERYSIARGLIPTILGIVFFGVAGALVRESGIVSVISSVSVSKPESQSVKSKYAPLASTALSAFPAVTIAAPAPTIPAAPEPPAPAPGSAPESAPIAKMRTAPVKLAKPHATRERAHPVQRVSKRKEDDETRYQRVAGAVQTGAVKPSGREVKKFAGCGQKIAERIIARMLNEGIIEREGQGYVIKERG